MDRYSRLVAWLKVLLPLTALALLSTLFLLSRNIDPVAAIPFADKEIEDRLRGQQLTAPFFSGTTDSGDVISISAGTMMTMSALDNAVEDLSAQIDLTSGTRIVLFADAGQFDMQGGASNLAGNVVITTSTGYKLTTDELATNFDTFMVESPGPVAGTGPLGKLNAGAMTLHKPSDGENAHLIFTNGVKLIYDPNKNEE
ncbi:MAG: LPS export ABC transporter periplasmic protein LptC [Pseudomonadota bacterium]